MRTDGVEARLVRFRPDLVRFVQRHAGASLRFETAEDLVQGVHLRALERAHDLASDGDRPFLAWMYAVARSHLADRRRHWSALKRGSGRLLRLAAPSESGTDPGAVAEPAGTRTGPSTFASRREQVVIAVRALDLLLQRDRALVQGHCEGLTVEEQAEQLGIGPEAARRARARALERFRTAFEVASRAQEVRGA